MDKKRDILEREDLRRNPYSVPEGYFDRLQDRLKAIPSQQAEASRKELFQQVDAAFQAVPSAGQSENRSWIRPVMGWAVGIAAALAVGVFVFRGGSPAGNPVAAESVSYEQFAYADLIPRTDPYIYFAESEETQADPAEEEMIDYLMQYQNY